MFSVVLSQKFRLSISVIGILLLSPNLAFTADQTQARPPMPVVAQAVSQQDIPVYSEYSARTKAVQQASVYARVSGILQKKFFTEGQLVTKGQLLYKIDDRKYQALVLKAEAQVSVAQANLNQAEREYSRLKGLYKNKAVSAQEVDSALSNLELAKANLQGQKAALNEEIINLDYAEVRSEIAGITGAKQQDIGSLVGTDATNSLLTTVTQLDRIHVIFAIPDTDFSTQNKLVQAGKLERLEQKRWQAELLDNHNKVITTGQIDFIGSQINPLTGSVQARAVFDNTQTNILPGQFVRVRVTNAVRKNIFSIPQKAVLQMGQQAFVYIVKEGSANLIPVQIAAQKEDQWLIESGLHNGDLVIINDLIKLRPKTPVQVLPKSTDKSGKQTTTR